VEEAERGGPGKTGPYGAPFEVEPLFVRRLTELSPGRNDSNPVWSPAGDMIAFERNQGSKKEIHIVRADGTPVNKVYYRLQEGEGVFDFFLPGIEEDVSYNAGVSWAPGGDRFVFMSNAATGNYDIYVRELATRTTVRLTEHAGKDGHAQWSPTTGLLVFVSGRSGKADLYLLDQVTNETVRLSYGEKSYLYPQWSPDGTKVAMIYGSNENHDIQLIEDLSKPKKSVKSLTTWRHDDLRPIWSPDGKKIAFYTNYNLKDDPKLWSIAVIEADGSGPTEGEGLAARVVAKNVVPDMELGPAWLPDSARIAYVKDELKRFNPIYIVNVVNKSERVLKTGTKMNHDVSCSSGGILAFRAQVEQWDHIYLAKPGDAVD
jgi:Tol biopolymer transport system component